MDLNEIKAAVDHLSSEEREALNAYLSDSHPVPQGLTAEDWLAEIEDIAREIRVLQVMWKCERLSKR